MIFGAIISNLSGLPRRKSIRLPTARSPPCSDRGFRISLIESRVGQHRARVMKESFIKRG
jgi:hypothetical protein